MSARRPIVDDGALNGLSEGIHGLSKAAGWWQQLEDVDAYLEAAQAPKALRDAVAGWFYAAKTALIHSEVSEMMEGLRKGLPDDHLPERSMEEVEAADIFIRLMDYCGARGLDISGATTEKLRYNQERADHKQEARDAKGGKKF